jgi:hypothetical protein
MLIGTFNETPRITEGRHEATFRAERAIVSVQVRIGDARSTHPSRHGLESPRMPSRHPDRAGNLGPRNWRGFIR